MEKLIDASAQGVTRLFDYGATLTLLILIDLALGFAVYYLFTRNQAIVDKFYEAQIKTSEALRMIAELRK